MALTLPRAEELLAKFGGKTIDAIGDAFVDSYIKGDIERLNPESHHVPLVRVTGREVQYRSGGAGNAARNLASLGAKSKLVTIRGYDRLGSVLIDTIRSEGSDVYTVSDNVAHTKRPTIEKRRYVTVDGVLLRVDYEPEESTGPMEDAYVPELIKALNIELCRPIDAVLVSDYGKGMLTKAFCDQLIDAVHEKQVPILADVKPAQAGYFVGVAMMAPNLKEASESLGKNGGTPEEIASLLAKRFNTEVFLTAGSQGICIAGKNGEAPLMVRQKHLVKVGDSSGCGDTAAAAILLAKLSGATSEEAAELANAAAAVTVSMVGAYAPKQEEVLRMLAS